MGTAVGEGMNVDNIEPSVVLGVIVDGEPHHEQ